MDRNIAAASIPIAVQGLYGKTGKLKDGLAERLAWDRAGMNGHASHHDGPVNDGDALARLCRGDSAFLPRWATADYNKVVLCYSHFESLKFTIAAAPLGLLLWPVTSMDNLGSAESYFNGASLHRVAFADYCVELSHLTSFRSKTKML